MTKTTEANLLTRRSLWLQFLIVFWIEHI